MATACAVVLTALAPLLYRLAGEAWLRAGRHDEARDLLREGVESWPADERIRMALVAALALAGRERDAASALEPPLSASGGDRESLLLAAGGARQPLVARWARYVNEAGPKRP